MEEIKKDLENVSIQEKKAEETSNQPVKDDTSKEVVTMSKEDYTKMMANQDEMLESMKKLNKDRENYKEGFLKLKKSQGGDTDEEYESDEDKEDRIATKVAEKLKESSSKEEDVTKKYEAKVNEIKEAFANKPITSNTSNYSAREDFSPQVANVIPPEVREKFNSIQKRTGLTIKQIEERYLGTMSNLHDSSINQISNY